MSPLTMRRSRMRPAAVGIFPTLSVVSSRCLVVVLVAILQLLCIVPYQRQQQQQRVVDATATSSSPSPKNMKFENYWNRTIAQALRGSMTTYETNPSISWGACQYGAYWATASGSSPWLNSYVSSGRYCGVTSALYKNGAGCGKCYRVIYTGERPGTNPGRPGYADVMVTDHNSASNEFNCALTAHMNITGANTGIFPVTYIEIPCVERTSTKPTLVILDGMNSWWIRILVTGSLTSVQSVRMRIGNKPSEYKMELNSGATYSKQLNGLTNVPVRFRVVFADGIVHHFNCFNQTNPAVWPVASGRQCVSSS